MPKIIQNKVAYNFPVQDSVVLGVDPGCIVAGFAILALSSGRTTLLDHGLLKMSSSLPLSERVGIFYRFFDEKLRLFPITVISLETPFLGKNTQSFLKLGYMRGILYLLQDTYKLGLCEFSPSEIKKTVTGYGGAEKEQVARLLMRLFPTLPLPDKYDVTDAIATGLCGLWQGAKKY